MYKNTLSCKLRIHLSNAIGKTTNRKIVVLESDDWGSIRTFSSDAYQKMIVKELNVDGSHYGYDSLESNKDMETLLNVLSEYKDSTGRPPVFTSLCNMGNPDLNKIISSGFSDYYFQPLYETLKEYPAHDKLLEYWKKGQENRLFVPALHGREHINVRRFMRLLKSGEPGFRAMVNLHSVGVSSYAENFYQNYLGALYPESMDEVAELHQQIRESGKLFEQYFGHKPEYFVAPNAQEPKELEKTLKEIGVRIIGRPKNRVYPVGDGTFRREWNWPGKKNDQGQAILVRNAFFEPVCFGEQDKDYITDWVENCIKEIGIAFMWKKPAVISTHRVNYIGYINPKNSEKGIKELRRLLKTIIKKWPDVEFMTSVDLGNYFSGKN